MPYPESKRINPHVARRTNSDFRCYKKSTIQRRIERRMGLRQIPTLAEYAKFLSENPDEITLLAKDMLIGVTTSHFLYAQELGSPNRTPASAPPSSTLL